MKYSTKQRQSIVELINAHEDEHVTVESLLKEAKEKNINISRATLYRALDSLVVAGSLKKITIDDKTSACYQLCGHLDYNHYHLVCTKCGKLIHLDCEMIDELCEHIKKDHGVEVDPKRIVFYGVCEDCQKK